MPRKILLVDDEPDIVVVMKFTLEINGFEVITAYDGDEGWHKAKECSPDLIILDVLMPKMLGDDLAGKLKGDPDTGRIPIIFLTNLPTDYLKAKRGLSGDLESDSQGNLYLAKTCTEEELLFAIKRALPEN